MLRPAERRSAGGDHGRLDSPIRGKVRVQTYPVEERGGLVWVYMGMAEPPPVEDHVPEQFLDPDAVVCGRIHRAAGQLALRGGEQLRRRARELPAPLRGGPQLLPQDARLVAPERNRRRGGWLTVQRHALGLEAEYPGLGKYPPPRFWRRIRTKNRLSICLPGIVRLKYEGYKHYSFLWLEPVDRSHYRLQFYVTRARGLEAVRFRMDYELYIKPFHHIQFNNQDTRIVALLPVRPERLYRPDITITAWRKLCEHARGEQPTTTSIEAQLQELQPVTSTQ